MSLWGWPASLWSNMNSIADKFSVVTERLPNSGNVYVMELSNAGPTPISAVSSNLICPAGFPYNWPSTSTIEPAGLCWLICVVSSCSYISGIATSMQLSWVRVMGTLLAFHSVRLFVVLWLGSNSLRHLFECREEWGGVASYCSVRPAEV